MAGMQTLHVGPARNGRIVRKEIRRSRGSASRRVDEIEPNRVTQQSKPGLGDDRLALRDFYCVPAAPLGPVQGVIGCSQHTTHGSSVLR